MHQWANAPDECSENAIGACFMTHLQPRFRFERNTNGYKEGGIINGCIVVLWRWLAVIISFPA